MNSTVVALHIADEGPPNSDPHASTEEEPGPHVHIAHVGDSRCYRFRNNKLEALTEDHSLLNDYIKMKRLTQEEIDNFPHKNVIVRVCLTSEMGASEAWRLFPCQLTMHGVYLVFRLRQGARRPEGAAADGPTERRLAGAAATVDDSR